jgi:hypothetical protein
MDFAQALKLVIREGTAVDGMVVETRAGIDPGTDRVCRLRDALAIVMSETSNDSQLDRQLANALFGLSFHMSETLNHWKQCDWVSEYTVILSNIESIFEGPT